MTPPDSPSSSTIRCATWRPAREGSSRPGSSSSSPCSRLSRKIIVARPVRDPARRAPRPGGPGAVAGRDLLAGARQGRGPASKERRTCALAAGPGLSFGRLRAGGRGPGHRSRAARGCARSARADHRIPARRRKRSAHPARRSRELSGLGTGDRLGAAIGAHRDVHLPFGPRGERGSLRCLPGEPGPESGYASSATGSGAGRLRGASSAICCAAAAKCGSSTRRARSIPWRGCAGTTARSSAWTARSTSSPAFASPIPGWAIGRAAFPPGGTWASSCAGPRWRMTSTPSPNPGGRLGAPSATKSSPCASRSRPAGPHGVRVIASTPETASVFRNGPSRRLARAASVSG